jgi:hypothetical protein
MTRNLTTLAAAAIVALSAVATPTPAEARRGGWIAAGILGGIATAAIVGSAWGAPYHHGYYGGPYYYGGGPYYYGGGPYYGGPYYGGGYAPAAYYGGPYYAGGGYPCVLRRERIWTGYGWAIRRVQVCY